MLENNIYKNCLNKVIKIKVNLSFNKIKTKMKIVQYIFKDITIKTIIKLTL